MKTEELQTIFDAFDQVKVLVIGDVMIDAYMWGNVDRISPEAPVPIVTIDKKENRMGGAANVALNLKSLGATPFIHAVIGNDKNGDLFTDLLEEEDLMANGIMASKSRSTTVKTRVLSGGNQLLRIDEEITLELSEEDEANFIKLVLNTLENNKIDLIVFEDYDKGLITKNVIEKIVNRAKELNIPTAVDPKKRNFNNYKNVSLFKPNLKELKQGLKVDIANNNIEEIKKAAIQLKNNLNADCVLVTLSELGILVCHQETSHSIPAHYRDITDVSGAGDTVISVAALCYALGMEAVNIAAISNLAGGIVCEKVGVVPIDKNQLWHEAKLLLAKD